MARARRPADPLPFDSIYRHGYARVAVATPGVEVASPGHNVARTLELADRAAREQAVLAVFPELGLSAYSNEDLFQQDALLDASLEALAAVAEASRRLSCALAVGVPLRADDRLFNCAVLVHRGRLLGVVPKSYLPNYREFYERRQFAPAAQARSSTLALLGQQVPFGTDLLFPFSRLPGFVLHLEICEDVWVPLPPSTLAALTGATVLANLSASDITVGKADYRRLLCASQSAKCVAASLYSAAGPGESTTELAWDGHALVYENGERLAESQRFPTEPGIITADLDLDHLRQERMRLTSFGDNAAVHAGAIPDFRRIEVDVEVPAGSVPLRRRVERYPYVPSDPAKRDERCAEVYDIQVQGLMKRLSATGIDKVVIGISGGLDSTQAALVAVRAFDRLGLPRRNVLGYTLPGFGTSRHTFDSAHALMKALGISAEEIDIRPGSQLMLERIGHPAGKGQPVHDVTYENVQAGERTSHLFRLANLHGGLVVGTGDLSELALGFTTYGVGDHMSHYNVNASVPKTLIQHLVRWLVATKQFDAPTTRVLDRIVNTEISPELVPGSGEEPAQASQAVVGPYELQDFNLYYLSRFGYRPSKVAFLALAAWSDRASGNWPDTVPEGERREYDLAAIRHWLEVFLRRFFQGSQFKRSAMPNGPKVGSGGSLSPRGDWRAPSDSPATVWLDELHANVPAGRPRRRR
ncbi:MAG: NAD(+) synthase [Lysobacterales bacterium]|nr:MAG: NAD(+) synthase [Xanthomonadales bacterium]